LGPPLGGCTRRSPRCSVDAVATHQLVEATLAAGARFILIEKREVGAIEALEPFIPFDWLERLRTAKAWEVDPKNPWLIAPRSSFDGGRLSAVLFDPAPDLVVVRRGFGAAPNL
jgi:hypothetical protein